ncbi:YbaK / prolyl-tRNA synthetases associated domain protein [Aquisphaera giovannonii]|uniref:YbaK / prolyl-tRNA synthetases associated domain protein n=1 Tax=Aquisphaera giovannonii TaxID=406548 RepID=A0A5B9WBV1_9BACT|nr:YbaK/EbsC family protein [Aquisphaera giovannonii]QEH38086.1 YbaK / prolyl-tRNA synthetases associated domain protein [Aquisphaera giovannonii]
MYVVDFLRSRHVEFETLLHRPASSSERLAGSVHVPGRAVAKSVLVRAGESLCLAILPATSRVDFERLAQALGRPGGEVRMATPEELESTFVDCEPGAVPPFGRLYGIPSIVDESLARCETIVLRANTLHQGVRMRFPDFECLEAPLIGSFAGPILGPSSRPSRRRAG